DKEVRLPTPSAFLFFAGVLPLAQSSFLFFFHLLPQIERESDWEMTAAAAAARLDLDGNPIRPMTICMIGAGGFIGSHLCEKLMAETPHTVLAVDIYNDKIKHLLDLPAPATEAGQEARRQPWHGRIQFHRLNIKHDSRLEGLIKMSNLVGLPPFAADSVSDPLALRPSPALPCDFCRSAFSFTKLFSCLTYRLIARVRYCSENNKRLIHFSTCEVQPATGWYHQNRLSAVDFSRRLSIEGEKKRKKKKKRKRRKMKEEEKKKEYLVLSSPERRRRPRSRFFSDAGRKIEVTFLLIFLMLLSPSVQVYSKVSGEPPLEVPMIDVSSKEFYGEGYDDS
ncbi:hypothetical protein GW17_00038552, partial [Ensete ventricosum]